MKVLALELSSARGSVALRDEGQLEFDREWPNNRKNSGPFFESLAEVQKQFGKPDMIVVGLGPGSYAGTRIAISAAIGLSFGGRRSVCTQEEKVGNENACPSIRLIGYPSICAIQCDSPAYCVIGDARRNSFFFARMLDNHLAEGPHLMTEAELREKLAKLDRKMPVFTTENLPQFKESELRYPAANMLSRLASESTRNFSRPPLEPMYLREPHITIPRK